MPNALLLNIQFRPDANGMVGCLISDEYGKQQDYVNLPGLLPPAEWIEEVRAAVQAHVDLDTGGRFPNYKGKGIPVLLANVDPDPVMTPASPTPVKRTSINEVLEAPTSQT